MSQEIDTLMPHDLINAKPVSRGGEGVLRQLAALAVHGPDEPALRGHAQASSLGARTRRSDARARRLRGPRRAPDALRPHLPDRDAGRSEHRSHRVAVDVRPRQRVRLRRDAVPRGRGAARSPRRCTFYSALEEEGQIIAQATRRASTGRASSRDDLVSSPQRLDVPDGHARTMITLMDVSPNQLVSVAASLDPVPRARRREPRAHGLEHAAPGRAAHPHHVAARRHGHGGHRRA